MDFQDRVIHDHNRSDDVVGQRIPADRLFPDQSERQKSDRSLGIVRLQSQKMHTRSP